MYAYARKQQPGFSSQAPAEAGGLEVQLPGPPLPVDVQCSKLPGSYTMVPNTLLMISVGSPCLGSAPLCEDSSGAHVIPDIADLRFLLWALVMAPCLILVASILYLVRSLTLLI